MPTAVSKSASLLAALLSLAVCFAAHAQTNFPSRAIRIVVPYPPGGSTDIVSRLVAARLGPAVGQPVIVENRPGADTILGAQAVARAEPDGHTLLFTTPATHTGLHIIVKNLPFDQARDFTPITAAVMQSSMLVVHASVNATNLRELIDYAKRNPGKLSYSTAGFASNFHLAAEQFKHLAGIDMMHVPYKGGAMAAQAVTVGEVPVSFISNTSVTPGLKSGKLRALAVLEGNARLKDYPDVPNIHEVLPDFDKPGDWLGFYGPARLPAALVQRLREEIVKSLTGPEPAARLEAVGMVLFGNTPEEFAKLVARDKAVFTKIAERVGIQPK